MVAPGSDPPPPLSPDALKRIGLGGAGEVSWLRRRCEGLPDFLRALRPTWRGLLLTILVAWALSWLGSSLAWSLRTPEAFAPMADAPRPSFSGMTVDSVELRLWDPLHYVAVGPRRCWSAGLGELAPLLAIFAAITLLRREGGSVRRTWAGALTAAASMAAVLWALLWPSGKWDWSAYSALLVPNGIVFVAGASTGAWLLFRATRIGAGTSAFRDSVAALAITAVFARNLGILTDAPCLAFASVFCGEVGLMSSLREYVVRVWALADYTVPILGGILLFVPPLIILHGLGFRDALRVLGRIAARRPAALLLAYLGLAVLAWLPLGPVLRAAFLSTGIISWIPSIFPGSILAALTDALQWGLFVYATALAANALAEVTPGKVVE